MIPAEEAKGRRHARTIYFPTDRSWEVVERLCRERPTGPIFLNTKGNKWTGSAVKCRFEDVEVAFGIGEMERQGVDLDVSEESIAEVMKTIPPTRESRSGGVTEKKRWEVRQEARAKLIAEQARKYGKRFNHYAFRRTFIADFHGVPKPHTDLAEVLVFQRFAGDRVRLFLYAFCSTSAFVVSAAIPLRPFARITFPLFCSLFNLRPRRFSPGSPIDNQLG